MRADEVRKARTMSVDDKDLMRPDARDLEFFDRDIEELHDVEVAFMKLSDIRLLVFCVANFLSCRLLIRVQSPSPML